MFLYLPNSLPFLVNSIINYTAVSKIIIYKHMELGHFRPKTTVQKDLTYCVGCC